MTHEVLSALPFTTGDDTTGGTVTYRLTFLNQMWMLEAVMAALVLLTDPDNWNDVGTVTPDDAAGLCISMLEVFEPMIGMVFAWPSTTGPANCLKCDGATHLKADYPLLYAVLDTAFIVDATHFKTPNLMARVIRGSDGSTAIGVAAGSNTITLTAAQLPAHTHSEITAVAAVVPQGTGANASVATPGAGNTGSTGTGSAINIQPLSLRLDYYIVGK